MIKGTGIDNQSRLLSNPSYNSAKSSAMPLLDRQNNETVERHEVIYVKKSLSKKAKRRLKILGIFLLVLAVLCFLFTFIGVPIILMNSIAFQRFIMFTNMGLHTEENYFRKYEIKPGLRNLYVSVSDLHSENVVSLGVWHLVPYVFEEDTITDQYFDFDAALNNSNTSILLYFHGTGEDRSSSLIKYSLFRFFFHVITFDYRSYGDSSKNELSEDAVVNDCVQLYEWLTSKTSIPIFVWGHSLGTALASRTVSVLRSKPNIPQPVGLVLEAPFTKMSEELYVHPYGKIFAWLPWFEVTVIKPLEKNGFVFDNSRHILNVECPIMILSSEDDSIVPYRFGHKLYEIAKNRSVDNTTLYYQFADNLGYDHNFLYRDPFVPYFINYFRYLCIGEHLNGTKPESK